MQKLLGILDSPRGGRHSCRVPVPSLHNRQQILLRRPCWSVGAHAPGVRSRHLLWRLQPCSLLKSCQLFPSPLGAKMVDQMSILLSLGPGSFTSQSLMPKAPPHIVSLLGFPPTASTCFLHFKFMPMIRVLM